MPCQGTISCNGTNNGNGNYMSAPMNGQTAPNMQTRTMMPQNGMQTPSMTQTSQANAFAPANSAFTTGMPVVPGTDAPSTVQSPYYTAGFLKQFIGRNMRVEFLIGTNGPLVDRIGTLQDVGASYIVLQPYLSDDLLMADLYSIKFVTIYD